MSIYPKLAYFQYSVNSYFSISQSTVTIHDQQHHAEIFNTLGNCFTLSFQCDSCYSIFSFMFMFCRSLFVLLYFWPSCCLFFFDIRILIAPLVSSNSSAKNIDTLIVNQFVVLKNLSCGLLGKTAQQISRKDR